MCHTLLNISCFVIVDCLLSHFKKYIFQNFYIFCCFVHKTDPKIEICGESESMRPYWTSALTPLLLPHLNVLGKNCDISSFFFILEASVQPVSKHLNSFQSTGYTPDKIQTTLKMQQYASFCRAPSFVVRGGCLVLKHPPVSSSACRQTRCSIPVFTPLTCSHGVK